MSAFFCGYCAAMAVACAFDWREHRRTADAVLFWLNIVFGVLNGAVWALPS